jgi:hypothetical protein
MKKYLMFSVKAAFLIIIIGIACIKAYPQKLSNIDLDEIKKQTLDKNGEYYYQPLLERFKKCDSTLTPIEYQYIYYGYALTDAYNPYGSSDDVDKMREAMSKESYNKALEYGLKAFKENPVDAGLILRLLICYDKLEDFISEKKIARIYFALLHVIYDSGDGKSENTAYVVIEVSDEYVIMNDLELDLKMQALVGDCDRMTMVQPNDKKIDKLYFNIYLPFSNMSKMFNDK